MLVWPLTVTRFKLHNPDTGEDMVADDFMIWPVSKSGPWAKIGSQDSTDIVTCADVGMHRNPKYWPNPCKFDPDRFIQGSAVYDANNKDAWIPFSKGIRNCKSLFFLAPREPLSSRVHSRVPSCHTAGSPPSANLLGRVDPA